VEQPPVNYEGHYYRPEQEGYGRPDLLRSLADGYFGLNKVFILNVALALGLNVAGRFLEPVILLLGVAVLGAVVGFASFPHNRQIIEGRGWDRSRAVLASVLMGLNSALCCGILGFVVMQQMAWAEMKRYGLKSSFFLRRKAVEDQIAKLEATRRTHRPS
jgi:hypothetical protein